MKGGNTVAHSIVRPLADPRFLPYLIEPVSPCLLVWSDPAGFPSVGQKPGVKIVAYVDVANRPLLGDLWRDRDALGFQANYVREALGLDDSNKLMFGLSFGYPDPAAAANDCVTGRASLNSVVTFHE